MYIESKNIPSIPCPWVFNTNIENPQLELKHFLQYPWGKNCVCFVTSTNVQNCA